MIGLVRPLSDDLDCKKQQNAINRKYSLMILKSDQSYSEGKDEALSISTIVSSIADNEDVSFHTESLPQMEAREPPSHHCAMDILPTPFCACGGLSTC